MKLMDDDFNLEYLEGDQEGIAVCSFTRPKAKNSISRHMKNQMSQAIDFLKFEDNIRVTIMRSQVPGIFCAGADLKERVTMKPEEVGPFVASLRAMSAELADLPMPTIAALDGAALGGGLELAMCCDILIAANNAKLGLTETKLAIIPGAGGTQRLTRVLGPALAKELIFTGRVLDGNEAQTIGLANHAVQQNDAGDAAYQRSLELALQISPNGPIALRMAKQAINKGSEVDLQSGLAIERLCYAQVIPTTDRIEGLTAFKEKRPPRYRGQ
ncbi:hypothetical protein CAPTEDRAFT_197996 [Capitella teleta]|uniref:Enoyl-CoA hydratase n=1 Tax=Capitella teleta TaxID=283909 RepID=R7T6Z0_CAPTE|nr:hypothetical protein CAPTEDRAFT_197996 [Capitella teleta]|eukprot:ELT89379.1 hypothetical protein CAPTEDRAFT_197996 [Capitella teleta]